MNSPTMQQNFTNINQGYASNVIRIKGGREGANMYPVAAGYTALLLDEENSMFFIKTNDASGIPRPLREFKYEEVTPADPSSLDFSKCATKEDLNTILNEIKKLQTTNDNNFKQNRRNNVNANGNGQQSI